jgi:hypothetical protein
MLAALIPTLAVPRHMVLDFHLERRYDHAARSFSGQLIQDMAYPLTRLPCSVRSDYLGHGVPFPGPPAGLLGVWCTRKGTSPSFYDPQLSRTSRQAAKQTEDVPKNGMLEINRLVGATIPNVDDGYSASMAVHFMAMFRHALVPDNSILIGALLPDGRIGAVSLLPAKVLLLIPFSPKTVHSIRSIGHTGSDCHKSTSTAPGHSAGSRHD